VKRVLIIGGYGNFGSYIARALATDSNISLLIGGRSKRRADAFAASLKALNPASGCIIDIDADIEGRLREIGPDIVIHTTGPFQAQDHRVARAAIATGAHYFDLADARTFVATIGELDEAAKRAGVAVIAGASSVPCLTAAFLDRCKLRFARMTSATYGIAAAQATNRGLGTAAAILSYVGKPFTILARERRKRVFGWQGTRVVRYPELGLRLFGYCDIPDLELFPERYPELRDLEFVGVGSAARSEDQAARHTTPAVIAAAETSRFPVKGSLRKTIPITVANRIDVSRRPDTRAICSPDIAHTTMP